jgi:putative ATPase
VSIFGATTENPSFEVNSALLSRATVYTLQALDAAELTQLFERAWPLVAGGLTVGEDALERIVGCADGDARRLLNLVEQIATAAATAGCDALSGDFVEHALARSLRRFDKGGEAFYDQISALHKSVRGSDPDAALYWLCRMLDGGADPLYLGRRLVRMASEDIGLADPDALRVTLAARDAYHFLGSPEGDLAIAEAVLYLATAPKSNRTYEAWGAARAKAKDTPGAPVPLHIRNAPTDLMKGLGYGEGYRYDPHEADGIADQEYLPDQLKGTVFYRPGPYGREKRIADRMEWWAARRTGSRPDEA